MTTIEEKAIITRIENQKLKNKLRQQKYRDKRKNDEEFKKERAEYQREYNKNLKEKYNEIMGVVNSVEEPPKTIDIPEIIRPPLLSKRQKIYKTKKNISDNIIPAYINRKDILEQSTINEYISKLNIVHKFFIKQPLTQKLKSELNKLINDIQYDEKMILDNMPYLIDINNTIEDLRTKYQKDNSFKAYLVPLTVVLGHIKDLNNQYQTITKVAKSINDIVQDKRSNNTLSLSEKTKIIDLDKKVLLDNLETNLKDIQDKVIYSIYTLFPSRREDDYRLMRLTYHQKPQDLNEDFNYLQVEKSGDMNFVFNQYKTRKKYGQKIYKVPQEITNILHKYISQYKLKENSFLFYANNTPKEPVSQSNFSVKVGNTFKKVYGIPISIRYIRKSHATFLYKISNDWSSKEITEYQTKMGHSDSESKLYRVAKFE